MILGFFRNLAIGLVPVALTACMSPGPASADRGGTATVPLGVDLGSSTPRASVPPGVVPPGEGHERNAHVPDGIQIAHEGHNDAHATGTVNSVDPAQHKINLSHQPIPELGWPAMTMDFPVAASVDLKAIKPGTRVNVTLEKDKSGMYQIQSVQPAGGGQ